MTSLATTATPTLVEAHQFVKSENWVAAAALARAIIDANEDPDNVVQAHHLLGRVLVFQNQPVEAEFHMREAIRLEPDYRGGHDDLIIFLDHLNRADDAFLERQRWWDKYGAPRYQPQTYPNNLDPERPLRIGYLSGDFRLHSMLIASLNVLFHQRSHHTSFYYVTQPPAFQDGVTRGLRDANIERWRELWDTTEEQAVKIIKFDQIDILVDLPSYTPFNGLPICAAKPAPINVTGLGYAMPTGWPAGVMDYLLTDSTMFPAQTSRITERLVHLPCAIPFNCAIPEEMDDYPQPLPERPQLAVFQRANKVQLESIHAWRRILERVPDADLVFKGPRFSSEIQTWIRRELSPFDNRVAFRPLTPCGEHIRTYNEMSLSLDTWPATGGVGTTESLWMGVPVLTLTGREHPAQAMSASILQRVGLSQFITTSVDDYVNEAVAWTTTRYEELGHIRKVLRNMMKVSPLCLDYDIAVGKAFQDMWRTYCKEQTA